MTGNVIDGAFPVLKRPIAPKIEACLRVDPKDLILSAQILGQGASSEVIAGTYLGTQVAVKRFYARASEAAIPLVEREIAILSMVRHPSIVLW